MTMIWMNGFDLGDQAIRFTASGTTTASTRFGYGLAWNGQNGATAAVPFAASSEIVFGMAVNHTGSSSRAQVSFRGDSGATTHIVAILESNFWRIERGGTRIAATGFIPSGWHYVEMSVTISDTVGTFKLRLNGGSTNIIDFSGDTKNGGTNTTIDRVDFGAYGAGSSTPIDDVYILNTSGSINNTFLGDIRVATLMPDGGGNRSQLVGSDGNSTDNYLLVDEKPYSTADYNGSATIGNGDTYTLQDLPVTPTTIHAAQVVGIMAKTDAGAGNAKLVARTAATDYLSSSIALGTTYATYVNIYEQNPNTSAAWTESNINGLEAGMEVS